MSLLERYGVKEQCLETIVDLHEATDYRVKGREEISEKGGCQRGVCVKGAPRRQSCLSSTTRR